MPRVKRWFPVSHDINADPEVWEMRHTFGEQSLAVWLQILSVCDRNEGEFRGDLDWIAYSLTPVWGSNSKRYNTEWRRNKIRMTIEWMANKGWIEIRADSIITRNHWKYHKARERNEFPPNLPNLSEPSEPFKNPDPATPEPSVVSKIQRNGLKSVPPPPGGKKPLDPAIKKWADEIYARDHKKYERLIAWITAAQNTYATEVIAETLRLFVPRATEVTSWWGYLDKILDRTEGIYNARAAEAESARHKEEDRELGAMFRGDRLGEKQK